MIRRLHLLGLLVLLTVPLTTGAEEAKVTWQVADVEGCCQLKFPTTETDSQKLPGETTFGFTRFKLPGKPLGAVVLVTTRTSSVSVPEFVVNSQVVSGQSLALQLTVERLPPHLRNQPWIQKANWKRIRPLLQKAIQKQASETQSVKEIQRGNVRGLRIKTRREYPLKPPGSPPWVTLAIQDIFLWQEQLVILRVFGSLKGIKMKKKILRRFLHSLKFLPPGLPPPTYPNIPKEKPDHREVERKWQPNFLPGSLVTTVLPGLEAGVAPGPMVATWLRHGFALATTPSRGLSLFSKEVQEKLRRGEKLASKLENTRLLWTLFKMHYHLGLKYGLTHHETDLVVSSQFQRLLKEDSRGKRLFEERTPQGIVRYTWVLEQGAWRFQAMQLGSP
jgi:hypothetical protein